MLTRISWHSAVAIHPWRSNSRQGTSYFLGPIRLKTSASRPSSLTSVAVSPKRRRAWISAVIRKTGAGSKWNESEVISRQMKQVKKEEWGEAYFSDRRHTRRL